MQNLLKALIGIGLPVLAVLAFTRGLAPDPAEPPPPPELSTAQGSSAAVTDPDGVWTLAADESFVGYRITEEWVRAGEEREAVARTDAVEGAMSISEGTVTDLEVVANLRQLVSDQERRDRALRTRYLETETHPRAMFALTEPIDVAQITPGEPHRTLVSGALTLHGATHDVTVDALSRWDGEAIEVVATVPVALADYGIRPPALPGFVFVDDSGLIELQLRFTRDESGAATP